MHDGIAGRVFWDYRVNDGQERKQRACFRADRGMHA